VNDAFPPFPGDEISGFDGSEQLIRDELRKDEKLLWSGHPRIRRGVLMTLPIVIFGIPWDPLFALLGRDSPVVCIRCKQRW